MSIKSFIDELSSRIDESIAHIISACNIYERIAYVQQ